ncbi:MAG TPA: hypothetical protein VFY17_02690 [Pilimelia sp.]|nr:hypothetical protein [Pilimelia sp.]
MTDFFADIPVFAPDAVAAPAPPRLTRPGTAAGPAAGPGRAGGDGYGRRGFLRAVVAGAGALAVSGLTWIGERLPAYANAAPGRSTLHPRACMNLDVPGDTPCWGRELIAAAYCAGDGRHRTDTVHTAAASYAYGWEPTCGGYAGWYWKTGNGTVNCWDGYVRVRDRRSGQVHYATTSCRQDLP